MIVNAAAYTAVDKAESEPDAARTINAEAVGVLAREAKALGAWLLHYSTDYVFDGSGNQPWQEEQATGPLSVYGQTKLDGEQQIAASGAKHLIFAPAGCMPRAAATLPRPCCAWRRSATSWPSSMTNGGTYRRRPDR